MSHRNMRGEVTPVIGLLLLLLLVVFIYATVFWGA